MRARPWMCAALLAGLLAAPAAAQPGGAGTVQGPPTLRVAATGEARMEPDLAFADFGVETRAATARQAGEENARTMERVIAALVRAGVPRADIETRDYNVFPDYRPVDRPDAEPQIVGYRVTNTVSARTTETGRVGALIDAALQAGANRVHSVRFGLRDPARARAEALEDAVRKARAEAEVIARAMGVRLGRVLMVATVEAPRPFAAMMEEAQDAMMMRQSATPISAREQRVTATVNVTFQIAETM